MHLVSPSNPNPKNASRPVPGQRIAARPWLWLPAPGARAVNTLAPYHCPATVIGVLVDHIEIEFDRTSVEVWPTRQMVAFTDAHPWPHRCRDCAPSAAPVDPVAAIAALRQRCAALAEERDALTAELWALRRRHART